MLQYMAQETKISQRVLTGTFGCADCVSVWHAKLGMKIDAGVDSVRRRNHVDGYVVRARLLTLYLSVSSVVSCSPALCHRVQSI